MKTLTKVVTLGKLKFTLGVDRDIAIKGFEEYPDVLEFLISKKDLVNEKNEESMFLKMLKSKELSNMYKVEDRIGELVAFVLPLMLKKGGENGDITARDILDYAEENGATTVVNSSFLELLMQAFFQGELEKPKVKFSMK